MRGFSQINSYKTEQPITSMELSLDGKYITCTAGKTVYFIDASTYARYNYYILAYVLDCYYLQLTLAIPFFLLVLVINYINLSILHMMCHQCHYTVIISDLSLAVVMICGLEFMTLKVARNLVSLWKSFMIYYQRLY